jgi:hypothetical protein
VLLLLLLLLQRMQIEGVKIVPEDIVAGVCWL